MSRKRCRSRHPIHPVRTALAMVAVWAGCTGSILGDDPSTGLEVVVMRGPIRPVVMEGETNSEPVEGARVRVEGIGAGGRTEGRTDAAGGVDFQLLPGRYEVEVRDCPRAMSLPSPEIVEVQDGSTTTVVLDCDTGIR